MKNTKRPSPPMKYYYSDYNELYTKIINIIGLLTSLIMIFGLILLCIRNTAFFIIFTPLIAVFLFYYTTHYIFNLFYKKFQPQFHQEWAERFWLDNKNRPSVDIFIPYSGEGIAIIKQTCLAAKNVDYENKKIFILDDSRDTGIKNLSEELGIGYISRPDKGFLKKAGNIRYAMGYTEGEFIAIFDADFKPEKEFLKDLLPYFSDEKTGIIQSPQFFLEKDSDYKDTILTKGSASLQEDFYKIIQPSRNNFHGAICVGTNVLYRRSSLKKAGGIAPVSWCEDFETGFNVTASGDYILYIPLILAQGRSPEDPQAYFNQHRRWCYSCMRLLFSKKMFKAPIGFPIRLSYLSNIFYYIAEAFSILVILLFSVMMTIEHHTIDTRYFVYFIPYFLFMFLIQPLYRLKRVNIGSIVASTLQSFTYFYTLLVMIINRKLEWVPSQKKVHTVSKHFISFIIISAAIISIETYNLLNAVLLKNITFRLWESYPFLGWFILLILTQVFLIVYLIIFLIKVQLKKRALKRQEV